MEIAFTFGLLGLAVVLFATERLRADLVAMLTLAALMLLHILTPQQALSGFASPATVTVAAMFVLSAGLHASGVVRRFGDRLLSGAGAGGEVRMLVRIALVIGPVSAFINNTAAVAIFLPIVLAACHRRGIAPGRVLMPMAFFAILGGTCTLIGTSTNILVSSMAAARDVRPLGMFEFAPVGVLLFLTGTAYLLLVGRRLLPARVEKESLTEEYRLGKYLGEVEVLPRSPLIGLNLARARLGERHDLEVLGILRRGEATLLPTGAIRLREGDVLLVKAPAEALVRLRESAGIAVRSGKHPDDARLGQHDASLVEAVVLPNSVLEGRTLKDVDFRRRYGATALAIRRQGEEIRDKIGRVALRVGDELLILVRETNLGRLRRQNDFVVLQELDLARPSPLRAGTAIAIVVAVVGVAATGLYPIVTTALAGCVAMVLTGCVSLRRAYESVEWKVIFLLAGVIPLGVALETTGAAEIAVEGLLWLLRDQGPGVLLAIFFLVTYLLTGFVSNNATAALMVPLALSTARSLDVDPRAFLMAITYAASAAFYTPIGYQTNLLVYGPGGYRFLDYTRVGGPLNVLFWIVGTLAVYWLFPF